MKAVLILAMLAVPAHAADIPATKLINEVEGVYKHRISERIAVPGKPDEKYDAENVVEVVRHDHEHIYLGASITSDNGRRCSFHGVAAYENGAFIYRDPNPDLSDKQSCMVTLSLKGDTLLLTDRETPNGPHTCKTVCGTRGSLGDYVIAASSKAKITYLPKLKASSEYRLAVKAYEETQR
jgi:hypothetical protein